MPDSSVQWLIIAAGVAALLYGLRNTWGSRARRSKGNGTGTATGKDRRGNGVDDRGDGGGDGDSGGDGGGD